MKVTDILETIGNTPLLKVKNTKKDIAAEVFVKVESYNPGHSAKDRIAIYMVEKAERLGLIKPGDVLVEATSGNTGFSLALVAASKGYSCILTVSGKTSKEKISMLKAAGAKVVICPAGVEPEDKRSYYSQAKEIAATTPRAYYINQNFNLDNSEAHYKSLGPEIWKQSNKKVTHLVCCVGTGGTISGTAKYLKEQNPDIKVIGVDAYGSVLKRYKEVGYLDKSVIKPYRVEGLGKTIIPGNVAFDLIDEFVKVTDENSAYEARALFKKEAIFTGYSSGAVMAAIEKIKGKLKKGDLVVGILPDHGSRYISKVFNDEWMVKQGFTKDLTPIQKKMYSTTEH